MRYIVLSIISILILLFLYLIYLNRIKNKEFFQSSSDLDLCKECVHWPRGGNKIMGLYDILDNKCINYTNESNDFGELTKPRHKGNYVVPSDDGLESNDPAWKGEINGCDNLPPPKIDLLDPSLNKNNLVLKQNLFVNYKKSDIEEINKLKGLDLENNNNIVVNKTPKNENVLHISEKLCIGGFCLTPETAKYITGYVDSPGFFKSQSPSSSDDIMLYNHDNLEEVPKSLCITNTNNKLIINNTPNEDRFIKSNATIENLNNLNKNGSKINSKYGIIFKNKVIENDCPTGSESSPDLLKGILYRGCRNYTDSRKTCQRWDDQWPHRHSRTPENHPNKGLEGWHNYCRNPDNSDGIWCYTDQENSRWEYCNEDNKDVIKEPTLPTISGGIHTVTIYLRLNEIKPVYGVGIQMRGDGINTEWVDTVTVKYLNDTDEMDKIKSYKTYENFEKLKYEPTSINNSEVFKTTRPKHVNFIKELTFDNSLDSKPDKYTKTHFYYLTNLIKVTGTSIQTSDFQYNYPSMRLDVLVKDKLHNCLTAEHLEIMNGTRGVRLYKVEDVNERPTGDISRNEDDYIKPYYIDYSTGDGIGMETVKSGKFYKKSTKGCDILTGKNSCIKKAFQLEGEMEKTEVQIKDGIVIIPNLKTDHHNCSDNGLKSIQTKIDKTKICEGVEKSNCDSLPFCKYNEGKCEYKKCDHKDNNDRIKCSLNSMCEFKEGKCIERELPAVKDKTVMTDDYSIKEFIPTIPPNEGGYFDNKFYHNLYNQPNINFRFTPSSKEVKGDTICNEAIKGENGSGYRGCQNKTKTGKICQKWTEQSPHDHSRTPGNYPDKGIGSHNYCRNPDGENEGIWCYTKESGTRWEYCNPIESKTSGIVDKTYFHGHEHLHDDNSHPGCADYQYVTRHVGMSDLTDLKVCKNKSE